MQPPWTLSEPHSAAVLWRGPRIGLQPGLGGPEVCLIAAAAPFEQQNLRHGPAGCQHLHSMQHRV